VQQGSVVIVQSILDLILTLLGNMEKPSDRLMKELKVPQLVIELLSCYFE
jgi:hypothetical protein